MTLFPVSLVWFAFVMKYVGMEKWYQGHMNDL